MAENYSVDQRVGLKTSSPGYLQVFTGISDQYNLLVNPSPSQGLCDFGAIGIELLVLHWHSSSVQPDLVGAELGGKCWL